MWKREEQKETEKSIKEKMYLRDGWRMVKMKQEKEEVKDRSRERRLYYSIIEV